MTALRLPAPAVRVLASAGILLSYLAALVVSAAIIVLALGACAVGTVAAAILFDRFNTVVTAVGAVLVVLILVNR